MGKDYQKRIVGSLSKKIIFHMVYCLSIRIILNSRHQTKGWWQNADQAKFLLNLSISNVNETQR